MKQVSKIVDGVRCVIGQATKKPNTVTMQVSGKFVMEAVEYFDALRKGEEITEGLIGLELIAHYAEDVKEADLEEKIIKATNELGEATQFGFVDAEATGEAAEETFVEAVEKYHAENDQEEPDGS